VIGDPATTTLATTAGTAEAAGAGIVIALAGSVFGLQFDAMVGGFVGGLVAKTFVETPPVVGEIAARRYLRGLIELAASGVMAGMLTPLAEPLLAAVVSAKVAPQGLHMAAAGIVGMVAPVVVPLVRKIVLKLGDHP
jgi:hypothetical protein